MLWNWPKWLWEKDKILSTNGRAAFLFDLPGALPRPQMYYIKKSFTCFLSLIKPYYRVKKRVPISWYLQMIIKNKSKTIVEWHKTQFLNIKIKHALLLNSINTLSHNFKAPPLSIIELLHAIRIIKIGQAFSGDKRVQTNKHI